MARVPKLIQTVESCFRVSIGMWNREVVGCEAREETCEVDEERWEVGGGGVGGGRWEVGGQMGEVGSGRWDMGSGWRWEVGSGR